MAVGERGISRESYPQVEATRGINCGLGEEMHLSPALVFFFFFPFFQVAQLGELR